MRTLFNLLLITLLTIAFWACDALVEDIEEPIDSVDSEELTSADDIEVLINGVEARFNNTNDNLTVLSSLLSDQFVFGGELGGGATFPTYANLNAGAPQDDSNSIDAAMNYLGEYLFLADDLLDRVEDVDQLDPDQGGFTEAQEAGVRQNALFVGNFHGGLARYFWATYFGRDFREGGGVISELEEPSDPSRGDFIPSDEMYELALDKFEEAETYATEYEMKVMNTIRARIYLYQNDLETAESYAEAGLESGDSPYQSMYMDRSGNQQNEWFSAGGPGRTQMVVSPRFVTGEEYLNALEDSAVSTPESARIPVFDATTTGTASIDDGFPWAQGIYVERDISIDFATWQENELILAEIDYRRHDDEDSAIDRVNEVRSSHIFDGEPLAELNEINLNDIYVERDKELFTMGHRLPDQRRAENYDLDVEPESHYWHLGEDTWRYLRITLEETEDNPNL